MLPQIVALLFVYATKTLCSISISLCEALETEDKPIELSAGTCISLTITIPASNKEIFEENYIVFAIENQHTDKIVKYYLQPEVGVERYNLRVKIPEVDSHTNSYDYTLRRFSDNNLLFTRNIGIITIPNQ